MNKAEKALALRLRPMLQARGFKLDASNLAFKRKCDFGFYEISFASFFELADERCQVMTAGLGVRHDRVDGIVNRLGHIWGDENRKNTTTIFRGMEFFPFDSNRDGPKTVRYDRIEEDAEVAGANLETMLLRDGFAFFEKYSSLLECSQGLNQPIEASVHPLCNSFPLRAYYGIVAAAMAEPNRVPELVQSYADFIRRNEMVDIGVYQVAKGLEGADAIEARLRAVADFAFNSKST